MGNIIGILIVLAIVAVSLLLATWGIKGLAKLIKNIK
jgi:hypothetical protein